MALRIKYACAACQMTAGIAYFAGYIPHTMHLLTMTTTDMYYPGFAYGAGELSAYILSLGIFIISLRNGRVVNHTPADAADFRLWLSAHHIRDISKDNGIRPGRHY